MVSKNGSKKKKRKLEHGRDDPPTPPLPRQPPPIVPRRTLPPRNPNAPLVGGSLQSSPVSSAENNHKQQHSFNALFSLEKEQENKQQIPSKNRAAGEKESSMIISPLQNSTQEPLISSPSVIPKTANT